MGMSDLYGPADEGEGLATLSAALDADITLIDTGDFYGMGHNEMLIGRAIKGRPRDELVISVKFGATRAPDGTWLNNDCRPEAVKNSLAYTLKRLGVSYVDVYRPARVDPAVPIEDTVDAIKDMVDAGWVRQVGLSEVGVDTIRRAHTVSPIGDVQLEYSLFSRGIEKHILPVTRQLGIAVTAYGVLARGLLSGHWSAQRTLSAEDYRAKNPRFRPETVERNLKQTRALADIAALLEATPAQVAIAWTLAKGPDIVPLIGARRRDQLTEALGASELRLRDEDMVRIEETIPQCAVAGERDAPEYWAALDSERPPTTTPADTATNA